MEKLIEDFQIPDKKIETWKFTDLKKVLEKNNFIKVDNVKKFRARTQDLKKKYFDTGNLVFVPCNKIKQIVKNQNNKPCHKFVPYLLEKKRAIDIDTYEDLRFAEMLYKIDNKK